MDSVSRGWPAARRRSYASTRGRSAARCSSSPVHGRGMVIRPRSRSRGSSATDEARSATSAGSTPDLDASPLTLTWKQTLSGGSHAGRWSLRRRAMRSRSTVWTQSKRSATVRDLLAWRAPTKCHSIPPGPERRESSSSFATASWTKFSANCRCPASHASRMRLAGLVLATATRVTLPGGRPKRRSAAEIRSRTVARASVTRFTLRITARPSRAASRFPPRRDPAAPRGSPGCGNRAPDPATRCRRG